MDYRLELLDSGTFENLVNTICQELFGIGVITFSAGKDGGRDGLFEGEAKKYPSENEARWNGKFVIQAKHTANPIASCSDAEFERLLDTEIRKLTALKAQGAVDCFILFTNRKYSAIKGEELRKKVCQETGLTKVAIHGKETINDQYLNPNKHIVRLYRLDKHHIPFDFSDQEIKDIILAFKQQLPTIAQDIQQRAAQLKYDYDRIAIQKKNTKNQLGEDYYKNEILGRSLMDFEKLQEFLDNPINDSYKDQYFDIAGELSQLITIKRSNFDAFEEIFLFIYQLACNGNTLLKGSKRHVTALLHYMYFECLIGQK